MVVAHILIPALVFVVASGSTRLCAQNITLSDELKRQNALPDWWKVMQDHAKAERARLAKMTPAQRRAEYRRRQDELDRMNEVADATPKKHAPKSASKVLQPMTSSEMVAEARAVQKVHARLKPTFSGVSDPAQIAAAPRNVDEAAEKYVQAADKFEALRKAGASGEELGKATGDMARARKEMNDLAAKPDPTPKAPPMKNDGVTDPPKKDMGQNRD